jgi:hypothetical protein
MVLVAESFTSVLLVDESLQPLKITTATNKIAIAMAVLKCFMKVNCFIKNNLKVIY